MTEKELQAIDIDYANYIAALRDWHDGVFGAADRILITQERLAQDVAPLLEEVRRLRQPFTNDEELKVIAAAERAATPGPWQLGISCEHAIQPAFCYANGPYHNYPAHDNNPWITEEKAYADARFISGARTWVPKLVAEVKRLRQLAGVGETP